jgi:hypothetical protein
MNEVNNSPVESTEDISPVEIEEMSDEGFNLSEADKLREELIAELEREDFDERQKYA